MKYHASFYSALFCLLHLSLAVLLCATNLLYYIREYYAPTVLFLHPTTEILEANQQVCGPFAENLEDIQIHRSYSREQAAELMKEHGAGIVQSVLTRETATDLRNYILKANKQSAGYYVNTPANRHHISLDLNTPIVRQALKEVAEHPVMRPLIDDLLGPAASLVSLNAITNLYGAKDQGWHADCEGAGFYPDHFVYEYGLGIALQDTTKEMGATGMCAVGVGI
jgi:hypothetical protein